jgi:rubrerythrin
LSKKLNGYLDHLRENLETLDEQIANARKMSTPSRKGADKAAALQWAKTLRDLVELRNTTLLNIKTHMLGRDETGATTEPPDFYSGNPEVMFERDFRTLLKPWHESDLRISCEDCGAESEDVFSRSFKKQVSLGIGDMTTTETEHHDLCSRCYEKRTAKDTDESEESSEASDPVSILKELAETQGEENVSSAMNKAMTGLVRNTIRAVALDARSPLEKVKMLEDFKAHLVRTAHSHATGDNIEPGVALLDKKIERLQKEAELGKGQDASGKPAT